MDLSGQACCFMMQTAFRARRAPRIRETSARPSSRCFSIPTTPRSRPKRARTACRTLELAPPRARPHIKWRSNGGSLSLSTRNAARCRWYGTCRRSRRFSRAPMPERSKRTVRYTRCALAANSGALPREPPDGGGGGAGHRGAGAHALQCASISASASHIWSGAGAPAYLFRPYQIVSTPRTRAKEPVRS